MRQSLHGTSREDTEDSQDSMQVQHDTASKATGLCCKATPFMFSISLHPKCALNLWNVFVSLLSSHTGTCCAWKVAVTDL